ncbi:hypothetical protein [Lacibacter sp. H407]|uniref:hypothetical protein n=1 Tax=Lacibacter sp. H407 TaxID=3133423 RepID=UPI0030BD1C21
MKTSKHATETKLLLILSFLTMIFIIQACRKYDFFGKTSKEFKVEDAKEWYYGVFKKSDAFTIVSDKNAIAPFVTSGVYIGRQQTSKTFYKKYPYWNKAINYSLGSLQVVEMPLQLEEKALVLPGMQHLSKLEKTTIAEGSITKLLFFKQTDGAITTRIVTLIPTLQYLKAKKFDISDNNLKKPDGSFEGFLMVQDWQGGLINLFEIKNAKYTRKIKISKFKKTANNDTGIELLSSSSECGWVITTTVVQYCVSTNGSSGDVPPGDPTCTEWQEYTDENWEYIPCEEEEIDPFTECIQMGNDNDYCNCLVYGVGCQGEDDPPGDGGNFDDNWNDEIKDSTNKPCIDSVLSDLSAMQSSLPKLVRDFFGKNPQFSPIIRSGLRNHTSNNNGDIIPAPGGWTISNLQSSTFSIYINSLYSDATDLSTVTTIIHEVFHAHLMNEVRTYNNDSGYVRQLYDNYGYLFPTVFADWLQNNSGVPTNTAHHQAIATMYRGLIADAINTFAVQNGINLPSGYANDLAWSGCSDSQAFQSLSGSEKGRIIDRIAAEKDPNNINGINSSNNSAKGKPCN